jgi:hypothetical protein
MFPNALCLQSVQSIMGAMDIFLFKVSWLALSFNSGYLITAGILLQIRNYTGSIGTPDSNQRCAGSQKAQTSKLQGAFGRIRRRFSGANVGSHRKQQGQK